MPNVKIPAYRQAGKCQMNVKVQISNEAQKANHKEELFDIDSFVIDLAFEI